MKKKNLRDIIFLCSLILIILIGFIALKPRNNGQFVKITASGKVIGKYSLTDIIDTEIKTENGVNQLVIDSGKAYISYADCKNNICVKTEAISKVGQSIVCLPHSLIVEITKE